MPSYAKKIGLSWECLVAVPHLSQLPSLKYLLRKSDVVKTVVDDLESYSFVGV